MHHLSKMNEDHLRTTICKVVELEESQKVIAIVTSDESEFVGFVLDGNYPIDFCPEQARK